MQLRNFSSDNINVLFDHIIRDVIEKVEKFKKNVTNACQKMMHNADEEGEGDRAEKQSPS